MATPPLRTTLRDFEDARRGAIEQPNRRYLRVTVAPLELNGEAYSAYLVDCPRRKRVGLESCVACPDSGRVRFHSGDRGPITIECSYARSRVRPLHPRARHV